MSDGGPTTSSGGSTASNDGSAASGGGPLSSSDGPTTSTGGPVTCSDGSELFWISQTVSGGWSNDGLIIDSVFSKENIKSCFQNPYHLQKYFHFHLKIKIKIKMIK